METEKWLRCLCPIDDGHVEKQAKASTPKAKPKLKLKLQLNQKRGEGPVGGGGRRGKAE